MPIETSANLGLDYVMPAQAQKHVTVNESFRLLDALVQTVIESQTTTAQPSDPADGDIYIIPDGAAGDAWSSFAAGCLAYFRDEEWIQIVPKAGWRCWVSDVSKFVVFDGAAWVLTETLISIVQGLSRLGVGTSADGTNPFSAKLNSALWSALPTGEGGTGDLRYVMNKESESDVLSVLFQSSWSGRAEFGLIGDNDLQVKVSDDGAAWREALRVDQSTGIVSAPSGCNVAAINSGPLAGLRNLVINGSFSVWARATSQTTSGFGSADRFSFVSDDPSFSVSRQVLAPDEIPAPLEYFARLDKPADGTFAYLRHRIENVRLLAAQHVTLSFWARSSDGSHIHDIGLYQAFGSGGSSKVFNTVATDLALTADWVRVAISVDLPAISGKTIGSDHYLEVFFNVFAPGADGGMMDVAGIQLEPGPFATPFEMRPLALEAALCGRYFQKKNVQTENGSRHIPLSPMRAAPTISVSAGSASALTVNGFELAHTSAVPASITADAEL